MMIKTPTILLHAAIVAGFIAHHTSISAATLPNTAPLTMSGDIASNLVAGVDRFLLREIDKSAERRDRHWQRDFSSPQAYTHSVEPNRRRLAHILGVRDPRVPFETPEIISPHVPPGPIHSEKAFDVYAIRWPAFGDVHGEGLLLMPRDPMTPEMMKRYGAVPRFKAVPIDVIAIPDADQSPEQIAGIIDGVPAESQYARRLAESGCRVLIPVLINRETGKPKLPHSTRGAGISNREFLYRSAFELGRHLIGYEVQKVLAAVDWLDSERAKLSHRRQIAVMGWGEGGMISLYAAALDPRIDATCVSGYFDDRGRIWEGPIDRNVFGLLDEFGDAELASLIAPRRLIVEAARGPELKLSGKGGGAPAILDTPRMESVRTEVDRAKELVAGLRPSAPIRLVVSGDGTGPYGTPEALEALLDSRRSGIKLAAPTPATLLTNESRIDGRVRRQFDEIDRHNQLLLIESPYVRAEFMKKLDTTSLEKYTESSEWYRNFFYDEVIGRFDQPLLKPNVRSRQSHESEKWIGYEVAMDVFPDVIAYGILLLPKDLKEGERRPVVVCQHGLEGRPQEIIQGDHAAYHDFAARLAERGFITFSPQNLYIFGDRFRTLQRKANPLKKTLFSIITPQHQQIVDWLQTLPNVNPERIAFYGLSYGGKTAMRVPALVSDYCLSICSADFNEWVWKNASSRSPYSYVWTGEYEIFEFDLGSTFNYAEMAALIAPRPFMVERGHFDGVAPDETVGYEFAKVQHLYAAKLKVPERCTIEWFVGPHTINGKGTFEFLERHLRP